MMQRDGQDTQYRRSHILCISREPMAQFWHTANARYLTETHICSEVQKF